MVKGFTLIELMIVVVIVAIIASIAYPSYRQYVERNDLANAQQEALRLSTELERFKNKNFSYKGFTANHLYATYDPVSGEVYLPSGSNATTAKYKLTLVDAVTKQPLNKNDADILGQNWAIKAERVSSGGSLKQPRNYDLLITSTGIRCMTKTSGVVKTFENCGGSGYESW